VLLIMYCNVGSLSFHSVDTVHNLTNELLINRFTRSIKSFDQGDATAILRCLICKFSTNFSKSREVNVPLSVTIFVGFPKIVKMLVKLVDQSLP